MSADTLSEQLIAAPVPADRTGDWADIRACLARLKSAWDRGDAAKRPPRPGRGKVQSYTFRRGGTGWECVAFHNTKRSTLMERISYVFDRRFRPLRERTN